MERRGRSWLWLALAVALVGVLLPQRPAVACSCAEPSLAEIVARSPEVAAAVVRRIDHGGGGSGVAQVVHTLRGQLPAQVALDLDTGASCLPFVPAGAIATLAFQLERGSWRTVECGSLDTASALATAFGDLVPDPAAEGPPAVAVTGSFPGGDVALLDAGLRPLAVADVSTVAPSDLIRCGDELVVSTFEADGMRATWLALDGLEVTRTVDLDGIFEARLSCTADGRVSAAGRTGDEVQRGFLRPDLTDDAIATQPRWDAVALHGDLAYVLRTEGDGARTRIEVIDAATGTTEPVGLLPFGAFDVAVAPDGEHLAIRGHDQTPVLVIVSTETGAVRSRSNGWWMPTGPGWIAADRLVLTDEDGEWGEPGSGQRVVDLDLTAVAEVPGSRQVLGAGGRHLVRGGGGYELEVAALDGDAGTSPDLRLTSATAAVLLGEVTGGAPAAPLPQPDPELLGPAPTARPLLWLAGAVAAGALAAAVVVRRRRDA